MLKQNLVMILSALLMVACAKYASNGENQYLKGRNGAPLAVPAPLSNAHISHFYDLPNQEKNANVNITPPFSSN